MLLVSAPLASADPALPEVALRVDRRTLAKRLWRGVADDGIEFGFQLDQPLRHGDAFYQDARARYVVDQEPEPVLVIALDGLPASAAAGIGWAVGNLHLEFSSEAARLLTPDEPAARQLFARIRVSFTSDKAIFRAGRFKRHAVSLLVDDLGPSHKH